MKTEQTPRISPELVLEARAGSRSAMEALYRATSQEIYRTVHAMVRKEDLALDIQQDTYVTAFTRLDQLRDPERFLPWLRQIAVNQARQTLRRKEPLLFTELSSEEEGDFPEPADPDPAGAPELALEKKETARLVRELLDGLSDGQRLLVGMYYYEQMPIREIAERLNITEGTVKNQLFRSKKKIEAGVKRLEERGVRLFGLAPLPFLTALLHKMEPAAEADKAVIRHVLTETGAAEVTAVHVGRRFSETVLGKVVLGLLAAGVIGGGVIGYRYWQGLNNRARTDNVHLEVQQSEDEPTDSDEDLILPDQPPAVVTETDPRVTESTEDPDPVPASTETTEPETTEPEPTNPPPTEPEPTNPPPTEPRPAEPAPTEPEPTEPAPTEPEPTNPPPTEPEPTEPVPTEQESTNPPPTEPEPTEPAPTEPPTTEPESTEPVEEPTTEPAGELVGWYLNEVGTLVWDPTELTVEKGDSIRLYIRLRKGHDYGQVLYFEDNTVLQFPRLASEYIEVVGQSDLYDAMYDIETVSAGTRTLTCELDGATAFTIMITVTEPEGES